MNMKLFSFISFYLSVSDKVSSCTLTNEYTDWTNYELVCEENKREPWLDNLMP